MASGRCHHRGPGGIKVTSNRTIWGLSCPRAQFVSALIVSEMNTAKSIRLVCDQARSARPSDEDCRSSLHSTWPPMNDPRARQRQCPCPRERPYGCDSGCVDEIVRITGSPVRTLPPFGAPCSVCKTRPRCARPPPHGARAVPSPILPFVSPIASRRDLNSSELRCPCRRWFPRAIVHIASDRE